MSAGVYIASVTDNGVHYANVEEADDFRIKDTGAHYRCENGELVRVEEVLIPCEESGSYESILLKDIGSDHYVRLSLKNGNLLIG